MATLQGTTPQNTFGNLLQVPNNNLGVDGTMRTVQDGKGNDTAFKVSTTQIGVRSNILGDLKWEINGTAGGGVTNPPLLQFRRLFNDVEIGKGSVGFLGSTEMNISNNMDYTTGSHRYYDATKNAYWLYLGVTPDEFGGQWVKSGHPNDDTMWTTYGKVIWKIANIPHSSTGEAVQYGSKFFMQQLELIDDNYTSPSALIKLTSQKLSITGPDQVVLPKMQLGTKAIVSTELASYQQTGANTFIITSNNDNNNNYNLIRYLKQKAGSFNLAGAGVKVVEFDVNGVGLYGARSTATVVGSFSNIEYYWQTTNAAGAVADRMVLSQEGALIVGGATPSDVAILQANSTTKGFLPPRMNTTQRDAISTPPAGLLIYNSTTNKLNVFTTAWEAVTSA